MKLLITIICLSTYIYCFSQTINIDCTNDTFKINGVVINKSIAISDVNQILQLDSSIYFTKKITKCTTQTFDACGNKVIIFYIKYINKELGISFLKTVSTTELKLTAIKSKLRDDNKIKLRNIILQKGSNKKWIPISIISNKNSFYIKSIYNNKQDVKKDLFMSTKYLFTVHCSAISQKNYKAVSVSLKKTFTQKLKLKEVRF